MRRLLPEGILEQRCGTYCTGATEKPPSIMPRHEFLKQTSLAPRSASVGGRREDEEAKLEV